MHQDYATTCQQRSADCDIAPDSDISTLLLSCRADWLALYASPIVYSVIGCFDEACAAIVSCLDDLL